MVMNLDREGRRDIVGVYNNSTEGSGILGGVLRGLKAQGARGSGLIISDRFNSIEEVERQHFLGQRFNSAPCISKGS